MINGFFFLGAMTIFGLDDMMKSLLAVIIACCAGALNSIDIELN